MAVLDGWWVVNDLDIQLWLDPKRYRVMIWKKAKPSSDFRSQLVRRMHDKDRKRILQRANEFIKEQSA